MELTTMYESLGVSRAVYEYGERILEELKPRFAEIDRTARQRVEQTVTAMAQAEGVTEELKAADPMKWVGLMNNLRNAAEETVLAELIYN